METKLEWRCLQAQGEGGGGWAKRSSFRSASEQRVLRQKQPSRQTLGRPLPQERQLHHKAEELVRSSSAPSLLASLTCFSPSLFLFMCVASPGIQQAARFLLFCFVFSSFA